jgi:sugar fermentation stimulation protein A
MARFSVDGRTEEAFVPNSGRLPGLMTPGAEAWLARPSKRQAGTQPDNKNERRTKFDLILVRHGSALVCVDTRKPNAIVGQALRTGTLSISNGFTSVRAESTWGHSRFDFCLSEAGRETLVEVKSVTLARDRLGLFPDAPTARGRRHVRELAEAVRCGLGGTLVFVVQREDVDFVSPNYETDPAFGEALRQAAESGVEVRAYGCEVTQAEILLVRELPVLL